MDEGRYNGADEPGSRPPPGELPSPILVELLERRARASAEDVMAALQQEETQTLIRALRAEIAVLRGENDTLRGCVGHFLEADVVATFRDSPVRLLSAAHDARAAQRQREVDADAALEEERSRRQEAESLSRDTETSMLHARREVETLEGEVARLRAEATVAEDELRTERARRQEAMDQRDYVQVLLESARGALESERGALEAERAARVNAVEARLVAEDGERYFRACHTAALNAIRQERARCEAAEDLQRYYRQNQTSAIRGLIMERTAHSSHVASLTAALTTAEQERTAERARREDAEDAVKCVICLFNPRTMVLRPCMHLVLCGSCPRVNECPICRERVRSRVRVVLS